MTVTILTTSERGIAQIKRFEEFMARLYNCPAGHCTIGYGHLVHLGPIDGREEERQYQAGITEAVANVLLRSDVRAKAEHWLRIGLKATLSQAQYDALASFTFNVGGGALLGSTLLKKVNAGDFGTFTRTPEGIEATGACAEFLKWNHAGGKVLAGLTVRRQAEAEMFAEKAAPAVAGH